MNQRWDAVDEALKAGRTGDAIGLLVEGLNEAPEQPAQVYRVLLTQLYRTGRHAEGEAWSAKALARFPKELEFWNLRGVFLRQLKRYAEGVAALDEAIRLNPKLPAPQINRGNILLDLGDGPRAEAAFAKLSRGDPRNAEYQRQLGRALQKQGKLEQAMVRWRQAVALKKTYIEAWLDLVGAMNELHRQPQAHEALDKAMAANPDEPRLHEARVILLRRAGELRKAEAYLQELLPKFPETGWVYYQLGATVTDYDRERANQYLRKAIALGPDQTDYLMAFIESLERTRTGDEGANIEEAYGLLKGLMAREKITASAHLKIAAEVLIRVCAFEALEQLGSFRDVGRIWAESGRHTALLKQMARVRNDEDRLELVEQHRIWGRDVEAMAAKNPIRKPPPRPADGKIRLGLMSSDLRRHPVAYFALPLFDHFDRDRFELYCYSYYQGQEDPAQRHIREQVAEFRWRPDISSRDAAQMIADDQLDMLIELGGTTHMNKLDVMAWRPAPRQASWLGYPHSAGLSTIDYFICDPFSRPTRPELMIETPLVMPHSWLALGRMFSDNHPIVEGLPEERAGYLTFGTANNPHKYSRPVLRAWAQVVAKVPGSKFAFIRPEGGTASFRANILAEFAAEGVTADRVIFHTVRGAHMAFYNQVDITLDPFPLTGGTTTCEALWMGVPVVSLRGEAFFERLSYSILSNAGVGELCAPDLAGFTEIALSLAADRERRRDLRLTLRDRIKQSPLGQGEAFARDFYEMIARAVAETPAKAMARA
ncbi:tetratricopeptide repeat protein [Phenylobacterium sp.]|uniref:O-linked N-acetylglucosamine transferase, SPINDLY family protein n=1 Tax=Phenylobacterium sp. TaxID=1871053 RepID=UPI002DEA90CE|nr:tetratricopeptide repeat protein [Phenylobacterium sp.]